MVKDTLNSIFDNVKERTTNPFLGTLIVVWSIKNWRLIYSLLYFDPKLTLDQRLDKISNHFDGQSFIWNMLITVAITIVVLLSTYIMLGISRLLTDFYDNVILPKSADLTSKGSAVVLKVDHLKLKEENKLLEARLEEERLAKVGAQSERDAIDQKLLKLTSTADNVDTALPSDLEQTFKRVTKKFEDEDVVESINNTIASIQTMMSVEKNNPLLLKLLREGFVEFKQNHASQFGHAYYTLTEEGRQFLRYWNSLHG